MTISTLKKQSVVRTAVVDILLLGVICIVPTLSHLFAFPFYQFNPMFLCMLAGMVLVSDRRNAYLLAILLPVVSMLLCGMPTPAKAMCMVPEMLTVVALFHVFEKRMPSFVAMVAAILSGKVVYYGLKAIVLSGTPLVTTNIWLQISVLIIFSILFSVFYNRK